ncbi:hypothetical protein CICLE_v10022762mg [Citrus x clementina]|uniref:Uncharacterized protein n=2 Tax=Citrus TaxID=2706 RepID=A0A067H0J7_CITSI|nr:uncharacterized protein LOC102607268 isoform X2 [Citrus sinensis]ESR58747.1 hypothetical protein CICLE_v10022762mg [Citrus x clementina]KDO85374.1 hypothetical protein CISIN_1g032147mg [Citrus sinensis]
MLGLRVVRRATPSTVVRNRIEDESKSNGVPLSLSFKKPSWVVRTESNVRKLARKKPEPPCIVCHGTGRVDCYNCSGKEENGQNGARHAAAADSSTAPAVWEPESTGILWVSIS